MTYALAVFAVGLVLSAFFSGSETGFYRVPRIRLVIDAVGGSRVARGLLWAANHPEAFVATALVGNNVANYLVSSAIVAAATTLLPAAGLGGEIALTLALAPVVFIFGELLPKQTFLQAPYRLLKGASPGLLLAGVVLAAPSSILWAASRALSALSGARIRPLEGTLRRQELADVLQEGHQAGVLSPAQRDLALATFSFGGAPIRDFMTPVARCPRLTARATADDALRVARRHQVDAIPIDTGRAGEPRCVRASRIVAAAEDGNGELPDEPMPTFRATTAFLEAITQLESHAQPLAAVLDEGGRLLGYVRLERLQRTLWEAA